MYDLFLLRIHLMWVNPEVCEVNKDLKMKIWFQKHAKMTFDFKENVEWTWKGREQLQVGVYLSSSGPNACSNKSQVKIVQTHHHHQSITQL